MGEVVWVLEVALGSSLEVFSARRTVSGVVDDDAPDKAGGGKRLKKCSNRGGSDRASCMCCSMAAIVCPVVDVGNDIDWRSMDWHGRKSLGDRRSWHEAPT